MVKGPQIMSGYWGKPEETDQILKDGWLYTGDIGKMDEDGYFYIVDRKKDMIIYNGYNVYPREIEDILYTHPSIKQAAVLGKKDLRAGEIPVAVVSIKKGFKPDKEELMDFVNKNVAPNKKIRELIIKEELLSTGTKIIKRLLKKEIC